MSAYAGNSLIVSLPGIPFTGDVTLSWVKESITQKLFLLHIDNTFVSASDLYWNRSVFKYT